jgi:hypothetical protein
VVYLVVLFARINRVHGYRSLDSRDVNKRKPTRLRDTFTVKSRLVKRTRETSGTDWKDLHISTTAFWHADSVPQFQLVGRLGLLRSIRRVERDGPSVSFAPFVNERLGNSKVLPVWTSRGLNN